jgi:inorganic pyrophosphatase
MSDEVESFQAYRPHPWHGIPAGENPPEIVNAYIEITPFDLVKYEVDKKTGYLKVDRPQRTSSQPPALYGFIPQTFCGEVFRKLSPAASRGDGDPLDICIISERAVTKSDVLITAIPIGGLQMVDSGEADDKIIGVLEGDFVWGETKDVRELPTILLERLSHFFLTYKLEPGMENRVAIHSIYGRAHAMKVIEASMADYIREFGKKQKRKKETK